MVKLDLKPMAMDPVEAPPRDAALPVADSMPETDGFVYGHAVKQPRTKAPDVEAMFKAAGIPGSKDGGLPHSLEWYRGAKARQAQRAIDREEFLVMKHEARQGWAAILTASLEDCSYRADCIMKEPQPLGMLAELLARTAHERPSAVDRIEELKGRLLLADQEKERLNGELQDAREALGVIEDDVRKKKLEADEEEEERLAEVEREKLRKAKAEKQLRRNEALIRGEEFDESDSDEERNAAAEEEELRQAALAGDGGESEEEAGRGRRSRGPSPKPDGSASPNADELRDIFGTGEPPTPGAVRGGMARELPPIRDPPAPPPLV